MNHSLSGKCIGCMSINKEIIYIRFKKECNLKQKGTRGGGGGVKTWIHQK